MFLALFQFKFTQAYHSNRLVFPLLPYGFFIFIRHYGYIMINGEIYQYKKYHKYILTIILIVTLAFGVLRNIPCFYYLRP
ncbi:hypothetical protein [Anaeromicropila herbilytica]|uniref:hypothetical protein n=1 Tax=Anaeromicropila herbilytica TaxID=2785025 RepID=UPI0038CBF4E2